MERKLGLGDLMNITEKTLSKNEMKFLLAILESKDASIAKKS